jgi:hypothetical protein
VEIGWLPFPFPMVRRDPFSRTGRNF